MSDEKSDLFDVTGLWEFESRAGNVFWAGTIREEDVAGVIERLSDGDRRFLMFKNKREKDTHAHFTLKCTKPRPRKED